MVAWEEFESAGLAVWCDKTAVLGAISALRGETLTRPGLLDAVGLVDAVVWLTALSSGLGLNFAFVSGCLAPK